MLARLPEACEATLVTDPEQWGGYGLQQPSTVADSPTSPLYAPFREHVDRHLDYVIETQGRIGALSGCPTGASGDLVTFPEVALGCTADPVLAVGMRPGRSAPRLSPSNKSLVTDLSHEAHGDRQFLKLTHPVVHGGRLTLP